MRKTDVVLIDNAPVKRFSGYTEDEADISILDCY